MGFKDLNLNPFNKAAPPADTPKRTLKDWTIGAYDWAYLCTPQWPWCTGGKKRPAPKFFALDAWLGIITAAVMGFQHALAMAGGLITVPFLIGLNVLNDPTLTQDEKTSIQNYLVSASLIVSGIMTFIQVTGVRLPFGRQLGSGVLSVMGISFTTYPIADSAIKQLMKEGHTFSEAYGSVLGTAALCGLVPLFISFMPVRIIQKVFPPVVCGVTIMLIGINLTGTGMQGWGGGAGCATFPQGQYVPTGANCTVYDPQTNSNTTSSACYTLTPFYCTEGDVRLPFGSPEYVGLGFSVFAMIILVELFGSPFLRNVAVIVGLIFGYILSIIVTYQGKHFVTSTKIDAAPAITFIWVKTFSLSIYAPIILPMIIVFCITSIETVGDVTATEEASFLNTHGPSHDRRIRGSLTNDGISGIFAALATTMPMTTFAQNNGVISLTAVASRQAGWACGIWLFCLGVLGKIGGIITSIPDCVLGGMTTFLFASVIASGMRIAVGEHLTRRNRFIMACSMALGIGVTLVPAWATNALWPCTSCSAGVKGLRDAVIQILSTGFCIGAVTSIILNTLLPQEAPLVVPAPTSKQLPLHQEKSVVYTDDDSVRTPKQMDMEKDSDASSRGEPARQVPSVVVPAV